MNEHSIIPTLSQEWIFWNSITVFFILFILKVSRHKSRSVQNKITSVFITIMILEFIFIHSYYIYRGIWTIQDSLPFHLCRIMWFVGIFLLLTRNQIAFELSLFIGMIGGFHSLLTPELTHGTTLFTTIDYFLVHGGLIAVPLFCLFSLGMRPRKMAWLRSFLYLQIFVFIAAIADYILGANYMYLSAKPHVNNPFLIGDWPYYILGLEIATLLHAILVYIPFYYKKSFL